ncbi:MAG: serpin family protein [Anaerolineae bacterium]
MKGKAFAWISALAAFSLVLAAAGCARASMGGVVKADELKSAKPRLAASLEQSQVAALVDGNTVFALALYQTLYDGKANLFCSPYSISQALAMTYAGARGATAQEMAAALRFSLPPEQLHPAFNALDQALASRGEGSKDEGERFRLRIANALWGQKDFAFQPAFLDLLAENYGAGLRLVDFQRAPEPARQTINRWVEEQTEQKIKDLLPEGSIDDLTRLVLSNAIYFNAGWRYPFKKDATQDGAFNMLDGSTVTVPLMQQSEDLAYAAGPNYQLVQLPYVGGELSMVILLPAEGQFEAFARGLDAAQLETMLQGVQSAQVTLTLPRFRYESQAQLKDALTRLGMGGAFEDTADFSGMTGKRDLCIDDVYHKAFVAVDEEGTEAAAAMAVVMRLTSAPAEQVEMRVDRPFLFLIRDNETGAILFLGHVVNPAG